MPINNATTVGFPDNTGGTMRLADSADVVDNVYVFLDSAGVKWERIADGPYRAQWAKILGGGSDMSSKLSTVLADSRVRDIIFDIADTDITFSGSITGTGKNFIIKNGCRLIGSGTITGGRIIADERASVIGSSLTWTIENQVISGMWFGMVADYNSSTNAGTDSQPALQKAINLLNATKDLGNREVFIPGGNFVIRNPLVFPNSASYFTVRGESPRNTMLWWGRVSADYVDDFIKVFNGQAGLFKDFGMAGTPGFGIAQPARMININTDGFPTGTQGFVGDMRFKNIKIFGNLGSFRDGICYTCTGAIGSSSDANNEQGTFDDVVVELAGRYALSFEHLNSTWHRIYGGRFSAGPASPAVVRSGRDDGVSIGGSFSMYGTTIMTLVSTTYMFDLYGGRDAYALDNIRNEGPGRIIKARGGAQFSFVTPSITVGALAAGQYHIDMDGTNTSGAIIGGGYMTGLVKTKLNHTTNFLSINAIGSQFTEFDVAGKITIDNYSGNLPTVTLLNNDAICTINSGNAGVLSEGGYKQLSGAGQSSIDVGIYRFFEIQWNTAFTLTSLTNGGIGKEIILYFANSNGTLGSALSPTGSNTAIQAGTLLRFRKAGAALGYPWLFLGGLSNTAANPGPTDSFSLTVNDARAVICSTPCLIKFLVKPSADTGTVQIGTGGFGAENILSAQPLTGGEWYLVPGEYFSDASVNFFFSGIVGTGVTVEIKIVKSYI